MRFSRLALPALVAALLVSAFAADAAPARAEEATWRSEQPVPPGSSWPIGLGKVGDIEFLARNRGLLITEGVPPSVSPGVWAYDGADWHPLSTVCGATDGRIAWAGPKEFWTVSDGRPGQTNEGTGGVERTPPLEDNTLCHFANGEVVASYAHPAFEPASYQAMHGAACLSASDCWFGGDALPEPQLGSFHLHWTGGALEAQPFPDEGHTVTDMRALEGHIYESARVSTGDRVAIESVKPPVVHRINPAGSAPTFEVEDEAGEGLPLYGPTEPVKSLDSLALSVGDGKLWAAAGRNHNELVEPEQEPAQLTVATRTAGTWQQLIGPAKPLGPVLPAEKAAEEHLLLGGTAAQADVAAVAAEPGTGSAWIALRPPATPASTPRAVLIHVSGEGEVLEEQTLPSDAEEEQGIGPKGAAAKLTCPDIQDCWLATTQGWLFHLAPDAERTLEHERQHDPAFNDDGGHLITFRPKDLGLPQETPDAPPPDTSGLVEGFAIPGGTIEETKAPTEGKVTLPLLTHLHSRLIRGTTLELRFHLAVKARVRLVAKRRSRVVAATPNKTFQGGNRKLTLRLNPRNWPTKLSLQTRALAPLPVVSSVTGEGANINSVSTALHVLPPLGGRGLVQGRLGQLP
jgi:hypothetical protein